MPKSKEITDERINTVKTLIKAMHDNNTVLLNSADVKIATDAAFRQSVIDVLAIICEVETDDNADTG